MLPEATDIHGAFYHELRAYAQTQGIRRSRAPYDQMVNAPSNNPAGAATAQGAAPEREESLAAAVQRLERTIAEMQFERERMMRRRRTQVLLIGVAISLCVHVVLLIYLAMMHRAGGGGGRPDAVTFEFATVNDDKLTELDTQALNELEPEITSDVIESSTDAPDAILDASMIGDPTELSLSGLDSTLGGSGQGGGLGEGSTLGGAGAGTSFFGVSSRGTRFAYIVDRSGSMQQGNKMFTAMSELAKSVSALPDYAHFYILLFSSGVTQPPSQNGWMRARKPTVEQIVRELNQIDPGGGTEPLPAFIQVYSLDVRPDVIFFLTDGEIPMSTFPEEVAALNSRGKRVIINTIAFGDAGGQEQLKQIARESGGVFRFVPTGGN